MSFLFDNDKSKVDFDAAITPKLNALKDTFQGYVNSIYNKFVNQGTTPTAKTPAAISAAVDTLATNKYNAGVSATKKGNAGQADVLEGKTFTNSTSVNTIGTMHNRGEVHAIINPNANYTIPQGYHNGRGSVHAKGVGGVTVMDSQLTWKQDQSTGRKWTASYKTNDSTCFAVNVTINSTEGRITSLNTTITASGEVIIDIYTESIVNAPNIDIKYYHYV